MPSLREWLRVLALDYRAWRCGLKRIGPRFSADGTLTRGRIYVHKSALAAAGFAGKSEPIITARLEHRGPDGALKGVHVITNRKE